MKGCTTKIVLSFLIFFTEVLHGSSSQISSHPSLISDARGRTFAVWLVAEADQTFFKSAVYFPEFGWSTPLAPSIHCNSIVSMPQIAINSLGEIVIAWESYCAYMGKHIIEAAFSTTDDGEWTAPIMLSSLDESLSHNIKVSIDDSGQVTAIWCSQSHEKPNEAHINVSVGQHNGSWCPPLILSEL